MTQKLEQSAYPDKAMAAQLCAERSRRIDDAINLRQPDRIPIFLMFGHLIADLAGITRQQMYENPAATQAALESAALRFQPDLVERLSGTPGMSRALGDRMTKWPGYGLSENESFQYLEDEFMKAEDYDAFLSDPADWAIRVYLPRVFSELKGLAMLPPLGILLLGYFEMAQHLPLLNLPPLASALQALTQGAQSQGEFVAATIAGVKRMAELGFPPSPVFAGAHLSAPFDFMGDTLRGMRGVFLDIRRCPDKLLAAEERVIPIMLETAVAVCRARHSPYAFLPLHRGSDEFMSQAVFERFYWPQLKTVILSTVANGITPFILWEGKWDQRLKYLAELPKGKTVGIFQSSDIFKVKEVLGETMCIVGGMPVTMLVGATPHEIREHTRKVCEVVGRNGGFIMSTDIGEMEGCNPELIKVWVDATRDCGERQI
jgi:hypothetical protein